MSSDTTIVAPYIALIVFGAIVVFSLIVAIMYSSEKYKSSKVQVFISVFAALSILITLLFYYNLIAIQNSDKYVQAQRAVNNVELEIDSSLSEDIVQFYQYVPNFILSMMPLTPQPVSPPAEIDIGRSIAFKNVISTRVFRSWEMFLTVKDFVPSNVLPNITLFLQRAASQQLKELWVNGKINFTANTQTLGDLLFEYAALVTEQTAEAYVEQANNLINNQIFIDL